MFYRVPDDLQAWRLRREGPTPAQMQNSVMGARLSHMRGGNAPPFMCVSPSSSLAFLKRCERSCLANFVAACSVRAVNADTVVVDVTSPRRMRSPSTSTNSDSLPATPVARHALPAKEIQTFSHRSRSKNQVYDDRKYKNWIKFMNYVIVHGHSKQISVEFKASTNAWHMLQWGVYLTRGVLLWSKPIVAAEFEEWWQEQEQIVVNYMIKHPEHCWRPIEQEDQPLVVENTSVYSSALAQQLRAMVMQSTYRAVCVTMANQTDGEADLPSAEQHLDMIHWALNASG
jgi:hypothetical protein